MSFGDDTPGCSQWEAREIKTEIKQEPPDNYKQNCTIQFQLLTKIVKSEIKTEPGLIPYEAVTKLESIKSEKDTQKPDFKLKQTESSHDQPRQYETSAPQHIRRYPWQPRLNTNYSKYYPNRSHPYPNTRKSFQQPYVKKSKVQRYNKPNGVNTKNVCTSNETDEKLKLALKKADETLAKEETVEELKLAQKENMEWNMMQMKTEVAEEAEVQNKKRNKKVKNGDRIYLLIFNWPPMSRKEIIQVIEKEVCAYKYIQMSVNAHRNFDGQVRLQFDNVSDAETAMLKLNGKVLINSVLSAHILREDDERDMTDWNSDSSSTSEPDIKKSKLLWRPDVDIWEKDPSGLYGLKPKYLKSLNITPPIDEWVHVTNFRCDRSELKELMEVAGHVVACTLERTSPKHAKVRYSHPLEAVQAVSMLHNQIHYGQPLKVVMNTCFPEADVLPKGLIAVGPGLGYAGKGLRDIVRHCERHAKGQTSAINTTLFNETDVKPSIYLRKVKVEKGSVSNKLLNPLSVKSETSNKEARKLAKKLRKAELRKMKGPSKWQLKQMRAAELARSHKRFSLDPSLQYNNMGFIVNTDYDAIYPTMNIQDGQQVFQNILDPIAQPYQTVIQNDTDNSICMEDVAVQPNKSMSSNTTGLEITQSDESVSNTMDPTVPQNQSVTPTTINSIVQPEQLVTTDDGDSNTQPNKSVFPNDPIPVLEQSVSENAVEPNNADMTVIVKAIDSIDPHSESVCPATVDSIDNNCGKSDTSKTPKEPDVQYGQLIDPIVKSSPSVSPNKLDSMVKFEPLVSQYTTDSNPEKSVSPKVSEPIAHPANSVQLIVQSNQPVSQNSFGAIGQPGNMVHQNQFGPINQQGQYPPVPFRPITQSSTMVQQNALGIRHPGHSNPHANNFGRITQLGSTVHQNAPGFVGHPGHLVPQNAFRPITQSARPRPNPMLSHNLVQFGGRTGCFAPNPVGNVPPKWPLGPNMNQNVPVGPRPGPFMGHNRPMEPRLGPMINQNRFTQPMPGTVMSQNRLLGPRTEMPKSFAKPENVTLEIINLPMNTTFPELSKNLSRCGQLMSLQLISPGCAVVQYANRAQADSCMKLYHNCPADGKIIQVRFL